MALKHIKDRRYFAFREYLQNRFGCRVQKVTLDTGFNCPNRDGLIGFGGCTFCNNEGFSVNSRGPADLTEIDAQLARGMNFCRRRYAAEKFIAYFQAYTNTYDSVEKLKQRYDRALSHPDVVGLAIGTRPDCAPDSVLDLIESYTDKCEVWLEYGLQSSHDTTLEFVNRGHDYQCFIDAMDRTVNRGIKICVHVILGLPGESREQMLSTARALSEFKIDGLKIHLLHIMRKTIMAKQFSRGEISVLSLEEYVGLVVDFLEWIPESVAIQRLSADAPPDVLVAPDWCLNKAGILQAIHREMERRDFRQGSRLA